MEGVLSISEVVTGDGIIVGVDHGAVKLDRSVYTKSEPP